VVSWQTVRSFVVAAVIVSVAGLGVGPARAERVAPARGGTLEVQSATTGAEVFVDG